LESCALVIEVEESLMHAVTALSGSGPAYVFLLAELMSSAGVELGLSSADSADLTARTMLGAARMLDETGRAPDELRRQVTSPGGTTEAALRVMKEQGVREAIINAIRAACKRSEELSAEPD
jgi:pyrroline-5-carboxylate reductase